MLCKEELSAFRTRLKHITQISINAKGNGFAANQSMSPCAQTSPVQSEGSQALYGKMPAGRSLTQLCVYVCALGSTIKGPGSLKASKLIE